jgi:hypothetical protein
MSDIAYRLFGQRERVGFTAQEFTELHWTVHNSGHELLLNLDRFEQDERLACEMQLRIY